MIWQTLLSWSSSEWFHDAIVAPVWLLANVLAFTVAWKEARQLYPKDSFLELLQHSLVLFWAGIVAVAMGLGGVGLLRGLLLLVCVLGLSLIGFVMLRNRSSAPFSLPREQIPWIVLWATLLAYWIAHVYTEGLWKFPMDWDSLAYHIPLVDHWLQSHSLYSTGCARWANPGNNELLALWAVAPFSGDFLFSLNNLPVVLLFACSAVSFGKRMRLPSPLAHLAALALVCNFVVFKQLVDNENDVAAAACFLATLSYALRYVEEPQTSSLVLGAISLGLLAGIKYYALGYAVLAFSLWILLTWSAYGLRAAIRVGCLGLGGILALGSFWYLRNWLMTGTPLYPKEFFKTPDLLMQIYPDVAHTSFFGNRRPELLNLYMTAIQKRMGIGPLVGFLLVPLSLVWLLITAGWCAFRLRKFSQARLRLAMALLLIGTGVLLGMTPFAVEDQPGTLNQMRWYYCPVRYGLCFLSTATLAAMLLIRDIFFREKGAEKTIADKEIHPWGRWYFIGSYTLIGLALAVTIFFHLSDAFQHLRIDWMTDLFIAMDLIIIGRILIIFKPIMRPRNWLAIFLVILLPAGGWACALLSERWHQDFISHYVLVGLYPYKLKDLTPQTILVLHPRCYPMFGSQRQHRVCQPVYTYSPEWLLEFIRREKVQLVVAELSAPVRGHRRFLGFDECLTRHPDLFRQVAEMSVYTVFEVLPPPMHSKSTQG